MRWSGALADGDVAAAASAAAGRACCSAVERRLHLGRIGDADGDRAVGDAEVGEVDLLVAQGACGRPRPGWSAARSSARRCRPRAAGRSRPAGRGRGSASGAAASRAGCASVESGSTLGRVKSRPKSAAARTTRITFQRGRSSMALARPLRTWRRWPAAGSPRVRTSAIIDLTTLTVTPWAISTPTSCVLDPHHLADHAAGQHHRVAALDRGDHRPGAPWPAAAAGADHQEVEQHDQPGQRRRTGAAWPAGRHRPPAAAPAVWAKAGVANIRSPKALRPRRVGGLKSRRKLCAAPAFCNASDAGR